MHKLLKTDLRKLCSPALLYFLVSMSIWMLLAIQNITGDVNTLRIGSVNMYVPNVVAVFLFKFIYILFWTWVLNLICKDGHSSISWLLVLVPLFLSLLGMIFTVNP